MKTKEYIVDAGRLHKEICELINYFEKRNLSDGDARLVLRELLVHLDYQFNKEFVEICKDDK